TVRKGDVETIAYNRDKGIGVTVYVGMRRGHANTADFSQGAIKDTVAKALTIARSPPTTPVPDSPIQRCSHAPGPISTFTIRGIFPSKTPLQPDANARPRPWRWTRD